MPSSTVDVSQALDRYLRDLRLPTVRECYEPSARHAEAESLSYEQYLLELVERECQQREHHRVERMLRHSRLPLEKDLDGFDLQRLPVKPAQQIRKLTDGGFMERKENVLAFGKPGSGKTHALCAIGQELIRRSGGRTKVYFSRCALLVQELLRAKQELKLSRLLKRLAGYHVLIIDDIGYVKHAARVYALSREGKLLGTYQLDKVVAIDFEDIAIGPGPVKGQDYLYIADTGNNLGITHRNFIVYRVAEPKINPSQTLMTIHLKQWDRIIMNFPDRRRYDCETLLVDPNSADIYLCTKDRWGSGVRLRPTVGSILAAHQLQGLCSDRARTQQRAHQQRAKRHTPQGSHCPVSPLDLIFHLSIDPMSCLAYKSINSTFPR